MPLPITVPGTEFWNAKEECFEYSEPVSFTLEHSLYSISKWEQKYHKPFLSKGERTDEETTDYIRFMCLEENINPLIFQGLNKETLNAIGDYIEDPMTATTFSDTNTKHSREIITNEIIYYWMVELNIPFECQFWHINHLLTLIRVCQLKRQPPKKMGKKQMVKSNTALNAARRAKMGSAG